MLPPSSYSSLFGKSALSSSSSPVHLLSNHFNNFLTSFTFFSTLPVLSSFFIPEGRAGLMLYCHYLTLLVSHTYNRFGQERKKRSEKKISCRGSSIFPMICKKKQKTLVSCSQTLIGFCLTVSYIRFAVDRVLYCTSHYIILVREHQ